MGYGDSLIGQVVGNYHILRELGRGGMGVVYKALETSLNRMVALKVLPPQLARDPTFIKRFLREARAAASLNHPNIVTIHAVGEHQGVYFIAMEYIKGMSLAELIRRKGRLRAKDALNIALQASLALREAHQNDIVHRDIKPQNIMIDPMGRVKVMDFGLAKALCGSTALTSDGAILGTPRYMSPEQCQDEPLDGRTDIYSLGVVLFEMLSGCPPFNADSPMQLMLKILKDPFPPLHDVIPHLPRPIAEIVERMTAKERGQRYASADDLVADIRSALHGVPGLSDGTTTVLRREAESTVAKPPPDAGPTPKAPARPSSGDTPRSAGRPVKAVEAPRAAPAEDASGGPDRRPRSTPAVLAAAVIAAGLTFTVAALLFGGFFAPSPDRETHQEQMSVPEPRGTVAPQKQEPSIGVGETVEEQAKTKPPTSQAPDQKTEDLRDRAAKSRTRAEREKVLAESPSVESYAPQELDKANQYMATGISAGEEYEAAEKAFDQAAQAYAEARSAAEQRRAEAKELRDSARKEAEDVRKLIDDDERRLAPSEVLAGDTAWREAISTGTDYARAKTQFHDAYEAYRKAVEKASQAPVAAPPPQTPPPPPKSAIARDAAAKARASAEGLRKRIGALERRYAPKLVADADSTWQAANRPNLDAEEAKRLFVLATQQYQEAFTETSYVAAQVRAGNTDILLYKGLTQEYQAESARQPKKTQTAPKITMEEQVELEP